MWKLITLSVVTRRTTLAYPNCQIPSSYFFPFVSILKNELHNPPIPVDCFNFGAVISSPTPLPWAAGDSDFFVIVINQLKHEPIALGNNDHWQYFYSQPTIRISKEQPSINEAITLRPIEIRFGPKNANLSITDGPAALE